MMGGLPGLILLVRRSESRCLSHLIAVDLMTLARRAASSDCNLAQHGTETVPAEEFRTLCVLSSF
jgi:hypothetical protein